MVVAPTTLRLEAAPVYLRAATTPETFDPERLTFELVASTGARVLQRPWMGEPFYEELGLKPGEVQLERLRNGAPILDSHRRYSVRDGDVMGVVESAQLVRDSQINVRGRFSRRDDLETVRQDVADGIVRQVSIGYRVFAYKDVTPEGSKVRVLRATKWEPFEVSFLPVAADAGAGIRAETDDPSMMRAAELGPHECTIETTNPERFRTMAKPTTSGPAAQPGQDSPPTGAGPGAAPANPNPETGGERAEGDPPADPPATPPADSPADPPADGARGEAPAAPAPAPAPASPETDPAQVRAEERARQSSIRDLARRLDLPEAWCTRQIDGDVPLADARVRALEAAAERDTQLGGGGSHVTTVRSEMDTAARGIETWLLHRAGYQERGEDGSLNLPELDDGARRFRGMRMVDLGRWWMENAHGVRCEGLVPMEVATRALHGQSHFPELLANVAKKFLRTAYDESPRTFTRFSTRKDLPDFKQAKVVQLGGAPSLVKLEAQGEVTRGVLGEYAEPALLSTYAIMLGLTRQAMVSDDLDGFSRIPRGFGAAAAATEGDLAYALLTDNVTMSDGTALFDAGHANLSVGTLNPATPGTGLTSMRKVMRKQTGIAGRILNLALRYLIVPAALETHAQQATGVVNPNAPTGVNPFASLSQGVIPEPRLDATSETVFYGACDPAQCDTLMYGYLEGMGEGPRVETRAGWNVDGTEIRCLHDFYVIAADFRGMVKSDGAEPA